MGRVFRIFRWRLWYLAGAQSRFAVRSDWEYYLARKKALKRENK